MNLRKLAGLCVATALCLAVPAVSHADTYTLANTNGGDGYIVGSAPSFQLFGSDNGVGANYTTYTTTASAAETVNFDWNYTTFDTDGSFWDPAGYALNGVFTQLSTDGNIGGQFDTSGTASVNLLAGDTFGFYVYSLDSEYGRGELAVNMAPTPEPSSLLLLGSGLLGMAGIVRRRLTA